MKNMVYVILGIVIICTSFILVFESETNGKDQQGICMLVESDYINHCSDIE